MNNKTLAGAVIAFIIILCVIFFCFWLGKSLYNRIRGTGDTSVNQPKNQPNSSSNQPVSNEQAQAVYLALGSPSNCTTGDPNNYSLVNQFMVICYNRSKGTPNWGCTPCSVPEGRLASGVAGLLGPRGISLDTKGR